MPWEHTCPVLPPLLEGVDRFGRVLDDVAAVEVPPWVAGA